MTPPTALLRPPSPPALMLAATPSTQPGWREGELFAGINTQDFSCVRRCLDARVISFDRGDVVWPSDRRSRQVGVLLDGVLLDTVPRSDGTAHVVDLVESGGLFGESSALREADQSHEISAVTAGSAIMLDATRLIDGDSACSVRPRVVDNLLRVVILKERRLRAHLDLVALRSLRGRLTHYLAQQSVRTGRTQFTIPLSRAQLASYLYADRAALSRELSRMQNERLVSFHRSSFTIHLSPDRLAAIV